MIIDTTKTETEQQLDNIKSSVYGQAERSHGWEYMVLSNDQETTGFPIEPLVRGVQTPKTDLAYLIDDAGIIWARRDGIFVRHCKGASLAYIIAYFGSSEGAIANEISLKQHDKWCLAAGESDEEKVDYLLFGGELW